ncbi:hypothetical protein [Glycomyces buryatensis]|uniref:Uncharacterized protein n=1 Tax=Glycomyces buryatensis TaxID=2570927 RepID=A0A4S8Q4W4_9ACTN|nr:hypothetical protein [Glycomyces buryatensis]THV37635.1 hypothetical protein FAB82_20375 [Glycomyces buryatensis]
MTYIFNVTMREREGTKVEGLLSYRGEGYGFYSGPEWGPKLLMDAWSWGVGDNDKLPAKTIADFEALFALFMGEQIWVDDQGYLLDQDTKEPLSQRIQAADRHKDELGSSSGFDNGYHYVMLKPRSDEFRRRTGEIIKSFTLSTDDDKQADFIIEVYDPRHLAHLDRNVDFKTTFSGLLP